MLVDIFFKQFIVFITSGHLFIHSKGNLYVTNPLGIIIFLACSMWEIVQRFACDGISFWPTFGVWSILGCSLEITLYIAFSVAVCEKTYCRINYTTKSLNLKFYFSMLYMNEDSHLVNYARNSFLHNDNTNAGHIMPYDKMPPLLMKQLCAHNLNAEQTPTVPHGTTNLKCITATHTHTL